LGEHGEQDFSYPHTLVSALKRNSRFIIVPLRDGKKRMPGTARGETVAAVIDDEMTRITMTPVMRLI
jgi:hypothetical protein